MNRSCFLLLSFPILSLILASLSNTVLAVPQPFTSDSLISLEFSAPENTVPQTKIGGNIRGNVQFPSTADRKAPKTSVGGGTRGSNTSEAQNNSTSVNQSNIQFPSISDRGAPKTSVGGGTRGNVQFPQTSDRGSPQTSVGGGTRGDSFPELTALLPPNKYGYTISSHPTIYVYLPPLGVEEVFFSLQDEEGNSHYHTLIKVSPNGGIVSVQIPPNIPPLELEKNYLWYFAPIQLGGILRPDNYAVVGWVKRVNSPVSEPIASKTPLELANEYAKAGLWYDTLDILAKAQRYQPNNSDLTKEWQNLLNQVGLEALADQPLES